MNQGLPDPCEHDKLDVTSGLTIQQRENLTKTAQHYLRMMHFRQIHKVRRNLGCKITLVVIVLRVLRQASNCKKDLLGFLVAKQLRCIDGS